MSSPSPDAGRRTWAVLSLVCVAVLSAVLIQVCARNVTSLLVGLVGLVLTSVGGWWVVAQQMPRRALGAAGAVLGLVVMVAGLADALIDADQIAVRSVAIAVLTVGAVTFARLALSTAPLADPDVGDRQVPSHPVLLCNPWSGGGKVERFGLVALAREMGVEVVMLDHGLDLEQLARDAVARGADCLGMAGGDGSQALVASIAIEHGLPFVCISAGTRNHFALDLGLDRDDPRAGMAGFVDAIERRIDYATVNGRLFVNNVSLGIYATVVQEDEYRDAKAATFATALPELLGPTAEPFDLQFSDPTGAEVDGAFLVMVSNNPYVIGASMDNFQRRSLDSGTLGVIAVDAPGAVEAARLITSSATGRRGHSPYWHEFTCSEIEIRSRSGSAFVGVDGEALDMDTPLRFASHPRGLRLLVPAGNLDVALRRRTRGIRLGDLADVALGRPLRDGAAG
jgi:diacylglycerol kinase family enzyme